MFDELHQYVQEQENKLGGWRQRQGAVSQIPY